MSSGPADRCGADAGLRAHHFRHSPYRPHHPPAATAGRMEWLSEAGKGDASCLGPLAGLEKQRSQYKAAVEALADPLRTRLVLVARAQRPRCARRPAPMKNWPLSACHSNTWSSTAYFLPARPKPIRLPLPSTKRAGYAGRHSVCPPGVASGSDRAQAVQPRGPRRSAPSAGRYRRHVWRRCHRAARPDQCTGLVRPGR